MRAHENVLDLLRRGGYIIHENGFGPLGSDGKTYSVRTCNKLVRENLIELVWAHGSYGHEWRYVLTEEGKKAARTIAENQIDRAAAEAFKKGDPC